VIDLLSGVDGFVLAVDQYFSTTGRASDLNLVLSSKDFYNHLLSSGVLGKHSYWISLRSIHHQHMLAVRDVVGISYIIEGGDMSWFNTATSRSHIQSRLLFEPLQKIDTTTDGEYSLDQVWNSYISQSIGILSMLNLDMSNISSSFNIKDQVQLSGWHLRSWNNWSVISPKLHLEQTLYHP